MCVIKFNRFCLIETIKTCFFWLILIHFEGLTTIDKIKLQQLMSGLNYTIGFYAILLSMYCD